jgi:hypothetical protein
MDVISVWMRFWMLSVVKEEEKRWYFRMFLCKCECGNQKIVQIYNLLKWKTISCGCYWKNLQSRKTHWMYWTPEYKTWAWIKDRCYNKNNISYKNYGGRWITVCDKWFNSFENFYDDMWLRPAWTSIDRIDTNWNYEPWNCKWSNSFEQARNKRNNIDITYNWEKKCLSVWSKELWIERRILSWRIRNWSVKDAFTRKIIKKK